VRRTYWGASRTADALMGDPKKGVSPPAWKLMIAKWCGLFPALVIVSYAVKWAPIDPPLLLKLFLQTLILVPLLTYVLTPLMDDLLSDWLYAGLSEDDTDSA